MGLRDWTKAFRRPTPEVPRPEGYYAYTKQFDVAVTADRLDEVKGPLSPARKAEYDEACKVAWDGTLAWRTSIDIMALEASGRIQQAKTRAELENTVVTILIDHSGSMRGQKVLLSIVAVQVVTDLLARLGIKLEILGFTTMSWHGGLSRKLWKNSGKPEKPGRLCDLLHIIYESFDDPPHTAHRLLLNMLRSDLLRENVDGEAIEWACGRLMERTESDRIMIMLSDGAPVDDSTLAVNDANFLFDHLKQVVEETSRKVRFAQLSIGQGTSALFERQRSILTPVDLGSSLVSLIEETILEGPTQNSAEKP
ncbi:cobalamin biosynthesis protein CobT [Mesorhizobium sp. IMUNJ 23232]|uniref:cobaltochelatase CobT-related protein n=1 Tax=Mesorhizobium sp. IMUNJ 23232 TaxID=3376064 RepID=UPI0037B312C3